MGILYYLRYRGLVTLIRPNLWVKPQFHDDEPPTSRLPVHQNDAGQWPGRDRAAARESPPGGREPLVSRGLEGRRAAPAGLRAPLRAPDVRGVGALSRRFLPAAAAAGGQPQRLDVDRPDQLLRGRPFPPRRAGLGDGIGPDGAPAAGPQRREAADPEGRREERVPPELREPAVRHGLAPPGRGPLPAHSSL